MPTERTAPKQIWTMKTAMEQIKACQFECEAGPLTNNAAYQWLAQAAKNGPEFWPGQSVWFEVKAEAAGMTLSEWRRFWIVRCSMASDTERQIWRYSLSNDPPQPWHYGSGIQFYDVDAKNLRLEDPSAALRARATENTNAPDT